MNLIKLNDFIVEQAATNPAEKEKNIQAKTDAEKEMVEIDKNIATIDLAISNLIEKEKEGSLLRSESYKQQGMELQKKIAEYQKKSTAFAKIEATEKK